MFVTKRNYDLISINDNNTFDYSMQDKITHKISIALASTTAPIIEIVMISTIIFSFSIIRLVWNLSSHLSNGLLLLICLPLLAVHIQLIF
jgi:hypothetical protein